MDIGRVLIAWNRVMFPDGSAATLEAAIRKGVRRNRHSRINYFKKVKYSLKRWQARKDAANTAIS
jgi:hypothetical protein